MQQAVYVTPRFGCAGDRRTSSRWSAVSVHCPKCGREFHGTSLLKDDDIAICPDCGELLSGEENTASGTKALRHSFPNPRTQR